MTDSSDIFHSTTPESTLEMILTIFITQIYIYIYIYIYILLTFEINPVDFCYVFYVMTKLCITMKALDAFHITFMFFCMKFCTDD